MRGWAARLQRARRVGIAESGSSPPLPSSAGSAGLFVGFALRRGAGPRVGPPRPSPARYRRDPRPHGEGMERSLPPHRHKCGACGQGAGPAVSGSGWSDPERADMEVVAETEAAAKAVEHVPLTRPTPRIGLLGVRRQIGAGEFADRTSGSGAGHDGYEDELVAGCRQASRGERGGRAGEGQARALRRDVQARRAGRKRGTRDDRQQPPAAPTMISPVTATAMTTFRPRLIVAV